MRFNAVLLGISSALFVTSVAMAHQDQTKLAEEQFKNIQVFKGQKASDIIPAMQFISASLKVGCDYCHVEDRASDEKTAKGTARKMILMTRSINEANFDGKTEVTCATCHAGRTNPLSIPPAQGVSDRLRFNKDLSADQILANYDAAVGGSSAGNLKGLRLEGESNGEGHTHKLEVTRLGNRFVMSETDPAHPETSTRFGYNGTQGWFARGTEVDMIPKSVMVYFLHQMAMYTGKASLPALDQMQAGTATIDGKDAVGVRGVTDQGVRAIFFFDKQTNYLIRAEFLRPTILGNIPLICDYSDFRNVDGVKVAMRIGIHTGEEDEDNQLKKVHSEASLDATQFDPPKK